MENFWVDECVCVLGGLPIPNSMGTEASGLWTLPDRALHPPLLECSFLFFTINHNNKQSVSLGSENHYSQLCNLRRTKQLQKSLTQKRDWRLSCAGRKAEQTRTPQSKDAVYRFSPELTGCIF